VIYFDTETCGLHGPIVLIQYAYDDGPIELYCPWTEPVEETLQLIEDFCNHEGGVCGFNLVFDWFHICQMYTTLKLLDPSWIPREHIEEYALAESKARMGDCLKPHNPLDLMLYARKGPYQSTMDRSDIRVKRVPTQLADDLAIELDKRIPLKDIYFARYKDKTRRWQVYDIKNDLDDIIPEFKDLVLKFNPSSALKALANDALGIDTEKITLFGSVMPARMPKELGYAPFATALGKPGEWNDAWPTVIESHINHWQFNSLAREYAEDDVRYTRMLKLFFEALDSGLSESQSRRYAEGDSGYSPPALTGNDTESVLACAVGAMRWRGYAIDKEGIEALKQDAMAELAAMEFNFQSIPLVKRYLKQVMTETEQLIIKDSTKKAILEELVKWKQSDVCDACMGEGCHDCDDGFNVSDNPHPVAVRAGRILAARKAKKKVELYDKLLRAGRFHASFKIIGTLSDRMSGADGLNPQAIERSKVVRGQFPFADGILEILTGGDFDGFEITIMDAVYHDTVLHAKLKSGKKIHALFGIHLFPGKSYDDILATEGLQGSKDLYSKSKYCVFTMCYGGDENTMINKYNIPEKQAHDAYQGWCTEHKEWAAKRQEVFDKFCSMRQPNGLGTKVEWHEPEEYAESLLGFRRYFTLENRICRALFDLAENPPKEWENLNVKVVRRDRVQTATGAARSALFACSFALQAFNMRAAANHEIQSTGAGITKELQREVWDIQPEGIEQWLVMPYNGHDELQCPAQPKVVPLVKQKVESFIVRMKSLIPLIAMTWKENLGSWADK
jgi:hypothetical protein